jgi:hypothetical protein
VKNGCGLLEITENSKKAGCGKSRNIAEKRPDKAVDTREQISIEIINKQ